MMKRQVRVRKSDPNQNLYFMICNNVEKRMALVLFILLYDKFDFTFKQLDNCMLKIYDLKKDYADDSNSKVTSTTLLKYAEKKKVNVYQTVKDISIQDKMNFARTKGLNNEALKYLESTILSCLLLCIPVLKESYRFTIKQMDEFLDWFKYYVKMYNTPLPKEKGNVFSDEYIRQIFIEDEKFDISSGEKVG